MDLANEFFKYVNWTGNVLLSFHGLRTLDVTFSNKKGILQAIVRHDLIEEKTYYLTITTRNKSWPASKMKKTPENNFLKINLGAREQSGCEKYSITASLI